MLIGIDASRAFLKNRTGIEEYSFQTIKHLADKLHNHEIILYIRNNQEEFPISPGRAGNFQFPNKSQSLNFKLPAKWKIKVIKMPYLWTQVGLSLEMLLHPVDVLFIPAHTVPLVHPRNTIVTVHGLEYEFCPQAYSWWERFYMRLSIRNSCRWAQKIIAVSENTKRDLMSLYKVPKEKIEVAYEGYDRNFKFQSLNSKVNTKYKILNAKYLLFIGRLEERKNIVGIIKAFEILKEHYKIPHQLVLAGRFGYGAEKIREELQNINCGRDIILPGFVSEEGKWELLRGADVFLFPTFYEGFGIPILEAQAMGVPVVASNNSSIPEVVSINHPLPLGEDARRAGGGALRKGNICECIKPCDSKCEPSPQPSPTGGGGDHSAILVDSHNAEQIADAAYGLISDSGRRTDMIRKGLENVKRFSWDKCAREIAEILIKQ